MLLHAQDKIQPCSLWRDSLQLSPLCQPVSHYVGSSSKCTCFLLLQALHRAVPVTQFPLSHLLILTPFGIISTQILSFPWRFPSYPSDLLLTKAGDVPLKTCPFQLGRITTDNSQKFSFFNSVRKAKVWHFNF